MKLLTIIKKYLLTIFIDLLYFCIKNLPVMTEVNIRSAFASANYIIENLHKHGVRDLTNLKLQKLLYFAYGMHIAVYEEPLFESEIQAWRLGPVIPDVYNEFKDRGSMPISEGSRARIPLESANEKDYNFEVPQFINEEDKIRSLYITCKLYGNEKAWKLVDKTHSVNSAWSKFKYDIKEKMQNEAIKQEFEDYIEQNNLIEFVR